MCTIIDVNSAAVFNPSAAVGRSVGGVFGPRKARRHDIILL